MLSSTRLWLSRLSRALRMLFRAAKRTTALIYAYKFPDTATDEQRTLLEQFRLRFESQLKGAPDIQAPLGKDGKQRHYFRFDNFIRAMIYQELKD